MFSPQKKLAWSMIAGSSNFWIPIAVLYHQQRGATVEQVLSLISFHYLCVVVLEYPTGVIGDYVGYKKSVVFGYAFLALSFFLLAIPGPLPYYFFCVFLTAVGRTFTSGSDVAWYHTISTHFRDELTHVRFISTLWGAGTMVVGGFVGDIHPVLGYLFTAVAYVIATILVFTIPFSEIGVQKAHKESTNIFQHAWKGLFYALKHEQLLALSLLGMLILGFFFSIKWFFNPIFEHLSIDVAWWGLIIASFTLIRALGIRVLRNIPLLYQLLLILLFIVIIAPLSNVVVVLAGFLLMHMVFGALETTMTVKINDHTPDTIRAATNSFQSAVQRIFSSLYLFFAGHALAIFGLSWIFTVTAIFLFVGSVLVFVMRSPRRSIALAKELLL